jgi:hypothetical protein
MSGLAVLLVEYIIHASIQAVDRLFLPARRIRMPAVFTWAQVYATALDHARRERYVGPSVSQKAGKPQQTKREPSRASGQHQHRRHQF